MWEAALGLLFKGENGNRKLRLTGWGVIALLVTLPLSAVGVKRLVADEKEWRAKKDKADVDLYQHLEHEPALLREMELHRAFLRELIGPEKADRIERRFDLRNLGSIDRERGK